MPGSRILNKMFQKRGEGMGGYYEAEKGNMKGDSGAILSCCHLSCSNQETNLVSLCGASGLLT